MDGTSCRTFMRLLLLDDLITSYTLSKGFYTKNHGGFLAHRPYIPLVCTPQDRMLCFGSMNTLLIVLLLLLLLGGGGGYYYGGPMVGGGLGGLLLIVLVVYLLMGRRA